MDVKRINPIVESTLTVLSTMTMIDAKPQPPQLKKDRRALGDITGKIDFSGTNNHGSLAISFSKPVILDITERMLGERCNDIDETVIDLVGEMTNMITGGAKRLYAESGLDFDLTRPTTLVGDQVDVEHSVDSTIIVVPFETAEGRFYIEFGFD